MKVNIQKLAKRLFPLFTVALVLFVSVIPAYAAEYGLLDYNDYITSTEFDGTNDNVVVKFPDTMCSIDLWQYYPSPNTRLGIVNDTSVTWPLLFNKKYFTNAYPMGYSSSEAVNNNRLNLDNIPDGTQIHFDLTYSWIYTDGETGLIDTPTYDAWVIYYSDTGVISSQQYTAGTAPGDGAPYDKDTWSFDITINKPVGAKSILFYAQLDAIACYEAGLLTFTLDNFSLEFSVSALYRLQEQTGKNSAVLSSIESKLTEQGQTIERFVEEQERTNEMLGDIQSGTPDQGDKAEQVQGEADDLNDQLEDAKNAFGQLEKPDIEFEEFLPPELQGSQFRDFSLTLSAFWEFDILLRYFMILGGIMLISFLLFGVK